MARDLDEWEAEWIHGVFVTVAKCLGCGQQVVISGSYEVDLDPSADYYRGGPLYATLYNVNAIVPGPRIIQLPTKTPTHIAEFVSEAATLLWQSPFAAANALRRAVESMLTDLKVPRYRYELGKKRHRYTTHARIDLLKATKPEISEVLMAVKWVGNSGSHESSLTVSQVLDTAGILAYALRLAYDARDSTILRTVAKINKTKGAV